MASQEFTIEERMPNLNDYTRAIGYSRYAGGEMKEEWDEVVRIAAKQARLGHFTEPITIEFHWYEPNTNRDVDNVAFAKKFILDGLQKAGVITNDNYKWVKGFSDHFHYDGTAKVHVIMTEIDPNVPDQPITSTNDNLRDRRKR